MREGEDDVAAFRDLRQKLDALVDSVERQRQRLDKSLAEARALAARITANEGRVGRRSRRIDDAT